MERPKSVGEHYRHNQDARPEGKHMPGLAQIEAADSTDEQISYARLKRPQRTLTNEEDKPTPGGDEKGLWNAFPEIPLPRWGMVFARNAPPKKYAK